MLFSLRSCRIALAYSRPFPYSLYFRFIHTTWAACCEVVASRHFMRCVAGASSHCGRAILLLLRWTTMRNPGLFSQSVDLTSQTNGSPLELRDILRFTGLACSTGRLTSK
ncbi:hypothetical protein EVAR_41931_1 [Eumeta japonica]|uniref:Uncharacterized protein n=1 Tax=Eumeta variegata TaxID=151549 RepID=A0A4C1XJJ3_EUMVA|nr:hypothetical protein EVAR_41931_1 [Eumeta japonica]